MLFFSSVKLDPYPQGGSTLKSSLSSGLSRKEIFLAYHLGFFFGYYQGGGYKKGCIVKVIKWTV